MSVCKTYISCHDIPCHQESRDKSMNYMRKACTGLKQEMSVTIYIFASRLWMVMSQSVQGVACNKELQRANKSGTFVNSSNGTYFSPRSLSDRLSRRNDGLIPAWTSQVMVYVNHQTAPRGCLQLKNPPPLQDEARSGGTRGGDEKSRSGAVCDSESKPPLPVGLKQLA